MLPSPQSGLSYSPQIMFHSVWKLTNIQRKFSTSREKNLNNVNLSLKWCRLIFFLKLKASLIVNFENYEILTNSKFAVNEKVNLIFIQEKEDFVFLQIIIY